MLSVISPPPFILLNTPYHRQTDNKLRVRRNLKFNFTNDQKNFSQELYFADQKLHYYLRKIRVFWQQLLNPLNVLPIKT